MRINHQLLAMVRAARTLPNRSVPYRTRRDRSHLDDAGYAERVRELALCTGSGARAVPVVSRGHSNLLLVLQGMQHTVNFVQLLYL